MSASIASTSASSDSTPGSKTSFKDLVESLDSLRDRIEKNKISKPWSNRMPQFEVLKEQLKRLQDKNLEEGISTGNVAQTQLPGIWRWLGKDVEKPGCPGVFIAYSGERERTIFDASTEHDDGKSQLEKMVDGLVEQMNSFLFHPQTQTWKPMTPADYVAGISRALSSILKFDADCLWARDKEEVLKSLKERIEKLEIENISHHGNEAGMLKEFYQILRGTGNHEFLEVHNPSERKKEIVKPNFDKLMKLIVDLERAIQGHP